MTFTIKPTTGWAIGQYNPEDGAVYYSDHSLPLMPTPQAVLDHVTSEAGRKLNLGPYGLVFIHIKRTSRSATMHYFQSFRSALRFHLTKSA